MLNPPLQKTPVRRKPRGLLHIAAPEHREGVYVGDRKIELMEFAPDMSQFAARLPGIEMRHISGDLNSGETAARDRLKRIRQTTRAKCVR